MQSFRLPAHARLANAACECGYSVNSTTDPSYAVFTELVENDFLHTSTDDFHEVGWAPQVYNVTAQAARGPYGKSMELENVIANPFKNSKAWSGDAKLGGDAGLQLWVRGNHQDGLVSSAELVSLRNDSLLGSFRVGMKLSNSSGTCGAFFFVRFPFERYSWTLTNSRSTTITRKKSTWSSSLTNSTVLREL